MLLPRVRCLGSTFCALFLDTQYTVAIFSLDFLGQLFTFCGVGPDGEMLPLCYYHGPTENTEHWTNFLQRLLQAFPSLITSGGHLVTDQDKGLNNAVGNVLPQFFHAVCEFHRCCLRISSS